MPRGNFHSAYTQEANGRTPPRLLDYLLQIKRPGDAGYFQAPFDGDEFAVVDLVRQEKAFFERPAKMDSLGVHRLIQSLFEAMPLEVSPGVFVV